MVGQVVKTIIWLTLINPVGVERKNELIIVGLEELKGVDISSSFVVRCQGKILPAQAEDLDFDGRDDAIAFLVNLQPKQQLKVSIESAQGPAPKFPRRTHAEISVLASLPDAEGEGVKVDEGRFIAKKQLVRNPKHVVNDGMYRFDGPLIESDKVGYRLYWARHCASDVYGKISDMFVGDYHRNDVSHHTMQPWGRDLLHNGGALGVGGLGIGRDSNRISAGAASWSKISIGKDGPVRSSLRMLYKDIEYKEHKYDLTWDISMSAGKRYMKNVITITKGDTVPMLAALTNHVDQGGVTEHRSLSRPGQLDWAGTYGKQVFADIDPNLAAKSNEQMGLGMLWPHRQLQKFSRSKLEFQAVFQPAKQLEYYSLAAYNAEKDSPITTSDRFYVYMDKLSKNLANPVIIKVVNDK